MKEEQKLSRSLKSRHIQMIAIGGAIGTGLFLGSGSAIRAAGPSIILSYLIVGIFCFFLMRAIGELLLSDTSKNSFIDFVKEYLGDRMEFITGWTYWFCWISLAMADLTATGIYVKYWFPNVPQWITPFVIILLLLLVNLVNVGLFGELESWFSLIKVVAILALVVVGVFLAIIHYHVGNSVAGFSNLVSHGGFFPTGPIGFLMSFQMVVFAFVGIEMVGLTAGETTNPEVNLPKAINSLPIRIGLFYIGSMIAIMSVYPWNKITTTSSPFVQVFSGIGIVGAAGILNFVVLTAAMSATNSALFSTSRTLHALARGHNAPERFGKLDRRSVPNQALQFSSLILFIIVILNYFMPAKVFNLVSGVSTINFVFVWLILLWCHLKYRKQHLEGSSNFKMPGYPFTDYLSLLFFICVLIFLLFIPDTRISLLISLIWFVLMFIAYHVLKRK
ncbi:amino acid permease [Loigolactobacillus backii]|uniref:amino acid permease n=1 Tax=Loigolactobacillus backii TaxID=375175 RepID=UPI0007F15BDE|nr:amino acid permease [Loigolactobacillus backii]ANK60522.1 D-alanine/D-serine/glycine permease [Loigolactobacillus backii]ANK65473.1 D-alanine/D-serine/glycine permease [Loigolactobacillus backii]ANK67947.1 D-alanine/D-serine/glycine permease [Loigolactobacillus backii]MDA5387887.1 amino acid permease [Loigolactobacillus backii]MDA5390379.1 amino acid permease [Loigolactobacillus backii]